MLGNTDKRMRCLAKSGKVIKRNFREERTEKFKDSGSNNEEKHLFRSGTGSSPLHRGDLIGELTSLCVWNETQVMFVFWRMA